MSELKLNPVDITFNALVQQMSNIFAQSFVVRDVEDFRDFAAFHEARLIQIGAVVVPTDMYDPSVFDDDEIRLMFEAWRISASIRVYRSKHYCTNEAIYMQMVEDISRRHNIGIKEGRWVSMIWQLIVDKPKFLALHGRISNEARWLQVKLGLKS